MSSWSSSDELCTGACRPSGSRLWWGGRRAYSDTGGSAGRDFRRPGRGPRLHRTGRRLRNRAHTLPRGLLWRRRRRFLRFFLAPAAAEANRGQPLQQAHALLLRGLAGRGLAAHDTQLILGRNRQLVDSRHPLPAIRRPLGVRRDEGGRRRRLVGRFGLGRRLEEQRRLRLHRPNRTSSVVIGSTAAATAALAAFSIASWACGAAGTEAAGCGTGACVRSALPAAAGRPAVSG